MKIVFFGTPKYCIPILNELKKSLAKKIGENPIVCVVTQRPRPTGRKQFLTYSPVDTWAHKRDVPIHFSANEILVDKIEADLGILVAYGEILSPAVIEHFQYGILNIHPSLLPKYRGASPLQAAIAAGEKVSGATIIKIDDKMDHGPIVVQFEEEIKANDTNESLGERIFTKAAEVLVQLLPAYIAGKIKLKPQDESGASYTTLLTKENGFIPPQIIGKAIEGKDINKEFPIAFIKNFSLKPTAQNLVNILKGLSPWPGIWTFITLNPEKKEKKRFKILEAHAEEDKLVLEKVQLEAKDPVSWEEFKRGYPRLTF
jgi:methionyl-tRNA formyltransferase